MGSRIGHFSAAVVALWSLASVIQAPGASACSCGPLTSPLVAFEGVIGTEGSQPHAAGRDYGFEIDQVIRGDVQEAQTVRIGDGSCAIVGQRLLRGGRYRIEAYESVLEGERLFANLCGGSVELLALPPEDAEGSAPSRWLLVIVPFLAVGATAGVLLRRRRRT